MLYQIKIIVNKYILKFYIFILYSKMPTPYMMIGGAVLFAVMTIVLGGMIGAITEKTGCK